MSTIPASLFSSVSPSVLGVGGAAVNVIGLLLTTNTRVPIGTVRAFPDPTSVGDFFGDGSDERHKADIYFAGFNNADALPGSILFAQYNQNAVAAYLRGGDAAVALTLAQLQALSGSLTAVVDGYSHVISSISLSAASSFSAAAAAISAAFTDPVESSFTASIGANFTGSQTGTNLTTTSVTGLISVGDTIAGTGVAALTTIVSQTSGTTGGAGVYVTSLSGTASSAACTAASTVLDVTVDTDHAIAVGQTLTGTSVAAGTLITVQISGTAGGVGLYRLSGAQQNVASEAMTGVATAPVMTFDSVSGGFVLTSGITGAPSTAAFATGTLAVPLLLTSATGATLSQGAASAVPGSFMDGIVAQTTNWVTFMTLFDPDGFGSAVKQAFAAWKNTKNNRYAYICWDLDVTPTASVPASTSLGFILTNNGDSGTCLLNGDPAAGWNAAVGSDLAAFVCGAAASIDFTETAGRITFAFKSQDGLTGSVVTSAVAVNLGGNPQLEGSFGNGYNYYGAVGSANATFVWFQRGLVTGDFRWLDSYINQIVLNNALQLAGLNLQNNSKSIPYTIAGDVLIEVAYADPIQAFLDFGAYAPGAISRAQATSVNTDAGAQVSDSLQTQGYYLQVLQAASTARASRTSPPCKFWYLDRGSVQAISLASVALQ